MSWGPLSSVLVLTACFSGDATVGAICGDASDCGPSQQCRHERCGRCGNGDHESGELCYGDPALVPATAGILQLRVADLDADGRDEVVTLDDAGAMIHYAPQGANLVATPVVLPEPAQVFALGDADGDGRGDIVAIAGAHVAVLGAGDGGAFAVGLQLDVGRVVAEAAVVGVREGTGSLAFVDDAGSLFTMPLQEGATPAHVDVGTRVHLGGAVYADDDDNSDLAVVDERQNRMGVVFGPAWDRFTRIDVGRGPVAVVPYDREGDGHADYLTLDRFGHTVTLVDGAGDGELRVLDTLAFASAPLAATAFDADLDGTIDVFVSTDASVEFWRGEAGRFPESVTFEAAGVDAMTIGRFGAPRLFEILSVRGGRLSRRAVDP